jgi:hypothetical protein
MRSFYVIATCLQLGTLGTASADPLDAPGTVYIDGLPCNIACQSYMAWSNKVLREKYHVAPRDAQGVTSGRAAKEAVRRLLSKRVGPSSVETTPAAKGTHAQSGSVVRQEPVPSTAAIPGATSKIELEVPNTARSPTEQVTVALSVAEQITAAETQKWTGEGNEDARMSVGDTKANHLVALLISHADAKSISALKGANIAIDVALSAAEKDIRTSLAAAGATQVQLTIGEDKPVDRVIRGEVPAGVLGLVSPDAAEAFPDVKGFKVLRVPLAHQPGL